MAYSNNVITAPVSIYDVQRALGVSSGDLATLCKHANINMWARYKPVRYESVGPVIFATRKNLTYNGESTPFGVQIPFCTLDNMNGKVHAFLLDPDTDEGWNYLAPQGDRTPQGGFKEFYRLTDFVRYPGENSPSVNGDPTPVNLQGYNHAAKVPFAAFLDTAGFVQDYASEVGAYYQINKQVIQQFQVTLYNSIGDDLHLQDFVDLDTPHSNNVAWRPVIQIYRHWYAAGGIPWYNRANPDFQFAGDAITTDPDDSVVVSFPLTSLNNNEYYHVCVGIGLVNPDFSSWGSNNQALFILPYTETQRQNEEWPFYYCIKPVSYQSRRLNVTDMQFYQFNYSYNNGWRTAGGTAPYFEINNLASGHIGIIFTISKDVQALEFLGENWQQQTSNSPLRIQARETKTGESGETIKYLTPSVGPTPTTGSSPWADATQSHPTVPAGSSVDTVTLYATLDIASLQVGQYGQYHLYADTGGQQMDNIGYFSIKMIQYSNS